MRPARGDFAGDLHPWQFGRLHWPGVPATGSQKGAEENGNRDPRHSKNYARLSRRHPAAEPIRAAAYRAERCRNACPSARARQSKCSSDGSNAGIGMFRIRRRPLARCRQPGWIITEVSGRNG